jgi:hypothetical protein
MKKIISLIVLLGLLASCVVKGPSQYEIWASQPTPNTWAIESDWVLILLDQDEKIIRSLIVRVLNQDANTCSSGDWKQLKILDEQPARSSNFAGKPAYKLKGSALTIDLSANLCDAGYELRGQLTNVGVVGIHQPISMFGGEVVGSYFGVPLRNQNGT